MNFHPLEFIIGLIIAIIFTSLITAEIIIDKMEKKAVKADVACYYLNERNGEIEFKYKQISEVK